MASMAAQTAEDDAAIEDYRAKFGDAEAAKFASQVYIMRQTQAAASNSGWARFPRWIVVLLAIWFALLETADKVPQLVLSLPKFEASLAEYEAKPAIVQAELRKAQEEAASAHAQSCVSRFEAMVKLENPEQAISNIDALRRGERPVRSPGQEKFDADCAEYSGKKAVP